MNQKKERVFLRPEDFEAGNQYLAAKRRERSSLPERPSDEAFRLAELHVRNQERQMLQSNPPPMDLRAAQRRAQIVRLLAEKFDRGIKKRQAGQAVPPTEAGGEGA